MSQTKQNRARTVASGSESAETDAANTATTPAAAPPTAPNANAQTQRDAQRNVTQANELRDERLCACGCGERVTDENNRGKRYVDNTHRQEAYRQRQGAQRRECIVCGTVFASVNQKICSDACRVAWREYRATLRHANGRTA